MFTSQFELTDGKFYLGFTLFETVISIALLLLVIVSFGGFVVSLINTRAKLQSAQEVQGNARMTLDLIGQYIRAADGVNDASSVWDTDPGTLSLAFTDPAKNPTIIRLSGDDGTLLIQEGPSPAVLLTSSLVKIATLRFTRYTHTGGTGTIGVLLALSTVAQSDAYTATADSFRTAVSVRK
ncbi:hypothetical protein HY732_03165 [Candidatus Uhrbacteria bacterium]|nr:hypothetical protein [Candidatus Uhrbacteria bacterium]